LNVDEDEQQIFDTINSLGVRLTTAELRQEIVVAGNSGVRHYIQTAFQCR
jgi:hypothetical protein